ncbi:ubiquinone oxidoreductase 20 kd subunit [Amylocystis lapponica]|nr:ubiquinone oxidoreductase 20 kd subunit [Amylocystis lapponica]
MNVLSRRVLPQLSRPLARLASTSTPVPASDAAPESAVVPQAPNYPSTWSTSQRTRPQGRSGPRFEQTAMELQPNPLSAMDLISKEPIRVVHGRKAVCDGGGGPLGHPKIFINLDKPGPRPCGYVAPVGLRFEQAPHHGHEH